MGLDLRLGKSESIGRAGSYSGFMAFRVLLALEEGIALREMLGLGGTKGWGDCESTLKPLLMHSDCDGSLYSSECEEMLPRMKEIQASVRGRLEKAEAKLERLEKDGKAADDTEGDILELEQFLDRLDFWVEAMERAVNEQGEIIFA